MIKKPKEQPKPQKGKAIQKEEEPKEEALPEEAVMRQAIVYASEEPKESLLSKIKGLFSKKKGE